MGLPERSRYRGFYFLAQAYELLGGRLYGPQWSGQEITTRGPEPEPPELVTNRLADAQAELARLEKISAELRLEKQKLVKAADVKAAVGKYEAHLITHNAKAVEEARLRQIDMDLVRENHDTYQRHITTRHRLFEGLKLAHLQAQFAGGFILPSVLWDQPSGYQVHLTLSLAKVPRHVNGWRRNVVLIPMTAFDAWLKEQQPLAPGGTEPSPKEQCEAYLKGRFASGPPYRKRDQYQDEATAKIPGLSVRAFKGAWDRVAPAELKRSGRRPSQ